jgi:hypothetical protein
MKHPTSQRDPWFAGETPVALHQVPKLLPPRSNGKHVSLNTVYRWTGPAGVHGVRLRRYRPAGARGFATTVEELQRFSAALTALDGAVL